MTDLEPIIPTDEPGDPVADHLGPVSLDRYDYEVARARELRESDEDKDA